MCFILFIVNVCLDPFHPGRNSQSSRHRFAVVPFHKLCNEEADRVRIDGWRYHGDARRVKPLNERALFIRQSVASAALTSNVRHLKSKKTNRS